MSDEQDYKNKVICEGCDKADCPGCIKEDEPGEPLTWGQIFQGCFFLLILANLLAGAIGLYEGFNDPERHQTHREIIQCENSKAVTGATMWNIYGDGCYKDTKIIHHRRGEVCDKWPSYYYTAAFPANYIGCKLGAFLITPIRSKE